MTEGIDNYLWDNEPDPFRRRAAKDAPDTPTSARDAGAVRTGVLPCTVALPSPDMIRRKLMMDGWSCHDMAADDHHLYTIVLPEWGDAEFELVLPDQDDREGWQRHVEQALRVFAGLEDREPSDRPDRPFGDIAAEIIAANRAVPQPEPPAAGPSVEAMAERLLSLVHQFGDRRFVAGEMSGEDAAQEEELEAGRALYKQIDATVSAILARLSVTKTDADPAPVTVSDGPEGKPSGAPLDGAVRAILQRATGRPSGTSIIVSDEELCALEVALSAEGAAGDGWLPIKTAPTNTAILIHVPRAEHYGPGVYRAILVDMGTGRRWHTTGLGIGRDLDPTDEPDGWQPLPAPPRDGGR